MKNKITNKAVKRANNETPIYKKALKAAKNKAPDWPSKDLDNKPTGKRKRGRS